MVIHKYLTNIELYLSFAKYYDKLLVVKTFNEKCGTATTLSATINSKQIAPSKNIFQNISPL